MTTATIDYALPTRDRPSRRYAILLTLKWLALICIVAVSIWAGWAARVWQFNVTEPTHFFSDVTRNWLWGSYTWANIHDKGRSFLDTYDDMGIQDRGQNPYTDYAPLRMAVFTVWAATNEHDYPDRKFRRFKLGGPGTRDFHAFYVDFNGTMEMIGAAGAFMLVRYVVRRSRHVEGSPEPWWTFTGVGQGLAAALIIWFNPAMWLSAHSWPGGDSWIIPPFIWAVYFATRRWWFTAGVILGIGSLFKGQQFFIALVFVLWPLFQGRPLSALRFICGIVALFGLATIGWTLTYIDAAGLRRVSGPAVLYVSSLVAAVVIFPFGQVIVRHQWNKRRQRSLTAVPENPDSPQELAIVETSPAVIAYESRLPRYASPLIRAIGAIICGIALLWPLLITHTVANVNELQLPPELARLGVIFIALCAALTVCFIPRRQIPIAAAALAGAGALLSMALFGTCFAWFDAGYLFGPTHWEYMVMGMTSNLPGIMQRRYGWDGDGVVNDVLTTFNFFGHAIDLTLRRLLMWSFTTLLVISAAGIAMHDRRRSTRFLIAICTPWLLFFCIPAQIHERYLLFGAAIAAVCIGNSLGMTLLGVFLSAVTWIMTMHVLNHDGWQRVMWDRYLARLYPNIFAQDNTFAPSMQRFLEGTHPDIGWAVLLATAIFFYMTVTPLWVRRNRRVAVVETVATPDTITKPVLQLDRPLLPLESIPLE